MIDPDAPAPGEIYRDPVYDGATDPTVVRDGTGGWWMFSTQRRANHPDAGTLEPDASGLSLSADGPPAHVDATHWAPEVIHDGTGWRMFLTEIEGVPSQWDGHPRHIVEYVSDDLIHWRRLRPLVLASDRVIDAAVAVSDDLTSWELDGTAIGGRAHEGPYVFSLGGAWWMLTDEWRGMAVHRSDDAVTWTRQGGPDDVILGEYRPEESGVQIGRHGAVIVLEREARLYYFTHPWWDGSELAEAAEPHHRRSAVHVARLSVEADRLVCAR